MASARPAIHRPRTGKGTAAGRADPRTSAPGVSSARGDDHGAGEFGERVVGEVPPCRGGGDARLGGHPPDPLLDQLGGGGA